MSEAPTHKLSPSPTYRTMPEKLSPARSGNGPVQGSANAKLENANSAAAMRIGLIDTQGH